MTRATIEAWVEGWLLSPHPMPDSLRSYARRCDWKFADLTAERDTLRQVRDILRADRDDMKVQRDLLIDAVHEAPCKCAPKVPCKRCAALERAWIANANPPRPVIR